jgi:hypothetical protein
MHSFIPASHTCTHSYLDRHLPCDGSRHLDLYFMDCRYFDRLIHNCGHLLFVIITDKEFNLHALANMQHAFVLQNC